MPEARPAVFLDRDGTVVHDPGFLHRPEEVRLLDGAARAIEALRRAGYAVVTVSNQSGIARGHYAEADYHAVQQRLSALLAAAGTGLDGSYFCPHFPDISGPCACRKPGTLLFERARDDLRLDLARSWFVGDRLSDVEPAQRLGGRGILVRTGLGTRYEADARATGVPVVADLRAAAALILR